MDLSRFHVVTMVSNPIRYQSRYRLYEQFRDHMADSCVNFHTVEVAFGDRPHHIHGHNVLHLKTESELWHKENALNLLVERLPKDWEYVAWIDADIQFTHWRGPNAWYRETVHQLQHYKIVQLFQHALDLGPRGEVLKVHDGFVYSYLNGKNKSNCYLNWHTGFGWAMDRRTWDETGGLIPYAVLGSADRHMAHAWIGRVHESVNRNMSGPYVRKLEAYQNRCEHFVKRDIGYLPGTIMHHFHGSKKNRRYADRWKILTETNFDPDLDIKPDWQGLYQLSDLGDCRSNELRDRIRAYFRQRNEDDLSVD